MFELRIEARSYGFRLIDAEGLDSGGGYVIATSPEGALAMAQAFLAGCNKVRLVDDSAYGESSVSA
jgi:hypothetical protein